MADDNKQNRPDPKKKPNYKRRDSGDFIGESKKDTDIIRKGAEIAPRPIITTSKKKKDNG
ncbi:hypothetical protein GCM10011506_40420 [Marivirga lumbricoides]|uniref:Multidrug transporter n=1 Tax=Marivirga lumbricoides TaxID=1046115 RepID=A0ABQ1N1T4_9BACT|nr:hypothetical protein GCM10011506_40420 [Marivirga lumbricoides]